MSHWITIRINKEILDKLKEIDKVPNTAIKQLLQPNDLIPSVTEEIFKLINKNKKDIQDLWNIINKGTNPYY